MAIVLLSSLILIGGCQDPQAKKADQDQAVDLYVEAGMLNDLQEWDDALKMLDKAIAMSPEFAMAYSLKGDIYQNKGDYEKSAESYEIATTFDPYNVKDFLSLGKVYSLLKEFAKAAAAYVRVVEIEPTNYEGNYGAAQSYYILKDWDKTIEHSSAAAKLDPQAAGPLSLLGDAFEEKKDHASAINAYRRALENDGNDPKLMVSLAVSYLRSKRYSAGRELLESAIQIDPDYGMAYQYLGFIQIMDKQKDLAMESYLKAVGLDPDDWMARKGLGVVYMLKGVADDDPMFKAMAIEQWNESLRIEPNQPKLVNLITKYTQQDQAEAGRQ